MSIVPVARIKLAYDPRLVADVVWAAFDDRKSFAFPGRWIPSRLHFSASLAVTNGVVGSEAEAAEQLETGFAIGSTIINGRVSSIAETEHAGLIYNLTS
jgi:hypothetical protein